MPNKTSPRPSGVDYDGLTKDLVGSYFDWFILLVCPDLFRAVDWSVPPNFLEQEMFNRLKGRYKVKGKHRKTDKFVRLRLLDGTDCFIYVHCEFQHRPEKGYGRRMFTYYVLSFLGYGDMERFAAITFFTGAAPKESELSFKMDCFGTCLEYKFLSFVAVLQDEQELLASDNPFSLAVLAAQYAQRTVKKPKERMVYKEKLIDLAIKKGWTDEKWQKLITFVLDFVHLPQAEERAFADTVLKKIESSPTNNETMPEQASFAVRNFAEAIYKKVYGFDPQEALLAAAQREREAAAAAAQREREAAAAAAQREREAERERIVFALNQVSKMPPTEIAKVMNLALEYVEDIIQRNLAAQSETEVLKRKTPVPRTTSTPKKKK